MMQVLQEVVRDKTPHELWLERKQARESGDCQFMIRYPSRIFYCCDEGSVLEQSITLCRILY